MGNDGGSIPKRSEILYRSAGEASKQPKESQKQIDHRKLVSRWTHDFLANKPLTSPVVSDCRGRLFNKESLIEFLLLDPVSNPEDAAKQAEQEKVLQGSIKGLKDVVEVKFKTEQTSSGRNQWLCPVTNKELGPDTDSVYIVPCGHAFAASVFKNLEIERCLECDEPFTRENVIPLVPTHESEIKRLELRMKDLKAKGLAHSLKKEKKRKREHDEKASKRKGENKVDGPGEPAVKASRKIEVA